MSKRTIFTTIIIPVLLVSVLVIVLVNNQQEFPGELVFTENKVDFGTIPEWEGTATRSVTARNEGKTTLKINRIKAGCSYAKITGPEMLQPNGEGTFKVVLNPKNVPSDATAATAILFTDSPRTPQVYLTIVAAAKQFATLSAEICDFGQIRPETTYQKKIKLCVNAPLNLEEIKIIPSTHPKHGTTDTRTYSAKKLLSSILTIAFPNERTLTLPITARIVRNIKVQPQAISFGAVDKNMKPYTEFTLSAKTEFKVLSIQVPDFLRVAAPDNWTQSLHAYNENLQQEKRFKVFWQVENSPMLLREEIQILTTAETIPISIPVYGLNRGQKGKDNAKR